MPSTPRGSVATDSPVGSITYLHVLNPPEGKRLRLELDRAEYLITLPDDATCPPIHTTIRLELH